MFNGAQGDVEKTACVLESKATWEAKVAQVRETPNKPKRPQVHEVTNKSKWPESMRRLTNVIFNKHETAIRSFD